jgi:hypothetical protein
MSISNNNPNSINAHRKLANRESIKPRYVVKIPASSVNLHKTPNNNARKDQMIKLNRLPSHPKDAYREVEQQLSNKKRRQVGSSMRLSTEVSDSNSKVG